MPNMTGRINKDELETIRAYLADHARLLARDDQLRAKAAN
jgi:hypothetical protein